MAGWFSSGLRMFVAACPQPVSLPIRPPPVTMQTTATAGSRCMEGPRGTWAPATGTKLPKNGFLLISQPRETSLVATPGVPSLSGTRWCSALGHRGGCEGPASQSRSGLIQEGSPQPPMGSTAPSASLALLPWLWDPSTQFSERGWPGGFCSQKPLGAKALKPRPYSRFSHTFHCYVACDSQFT